MAGTVQGTEGDDIIDAGYTGDPQGDVIDGGDATLPGAAPDDDLVIAGGGDDFVEAGESDDEVYGGTGDDNMYGEAGNDTLFGEEGNDLLFGGAGDDIVLGGDGNDILKGDAGDDTIVTGAGHDFAFGGDGRDTVVAGSGDVVDGGAGGEDMDVLDLTGVGAYRFEDLTPDSNGNGFDGTVVLLDGDGNPTGETIRFTEIEAFIDDENSDPVAMDDVATTLIDTSVTVTVLENDSDPDGDTLTVTSATAANGVVVINADNTVTYTPDPGFLGEDTITYTIDDGNGGTDTAMVTVTVSEPDVTGPDGTVEGTGGDDLIDIGYDGDPEGDFIDNDDGFLPGFEADNDLVYGFDGDDTVFAGEGDDLVYGGSGDDTLYGEAGNDTLIGNTGNDTLFGGDGDDELRSGLGDNTFDGGAGNDLMAGGSGNDTFTADGGNNTVYGGGGDDLIDTRTDGLPQFDNPYPPLPVDPDVLNNRDTVFGDGGNDTIFTGDDRDTIFGGEGDDYVDAGIDDDLVYGGAGNDSIIGGEGNDTVYAGNGDDVIYGGLAPEFPDELNIPDEDGDLVPDNGQDLLYGGAGNDTIFGLDDDDTLQGGDGDDYLDGGVDDDLVYGGIGNDTIIGGQGTDTMFGGDDRDVFVVGSNADGTGDTVSGGAGGDDFDVLDLSTAGPLRIVNVTPDSDGNGIDGTVEFLDGDGNVVGTLDFTNIEEVIPCFTPGTTIATPRGERLVEELREGDRIITRDNGIQEIRWVGHKLMTGKDLVGTPYLRPILIKAGALGNGLPERDMMVSPNHRLLVSNERTQLYFEESEVLAAAKHMVGAPGIVEIDVMQTTYVHFMFDRHEVVLSNGAWTESFQPGDYSLRGIGNAQRNEIFELFPELATKEGVEGYQAARKSLKKHEARLLMK